MTMVGSAVVIVGAVLLGTVLQRLSGTGVGLVVAPVLSILLGPGLGVLITNMTTFVSGLLIMLSVWSSIDWRRFWLIMPPSVVGAIPGAWVVAELPSGWLAILLGSLVVAALLVTGSLRTLPRWGGFVPTAMSGFLGGFFNTTSGVAAPVMVIYSRLSRWEQLSFAATLQPIFMTMGAVSALSKLAMGSVETTGEQGPDLGWLFPMIVLTVLLGIGLGSWLTRRVSVSAARRLAMALAALGGVGAILRGATEVLS